MNDYSNESMIVYSRQLLHWVRWCGLILALACGLAACDERWGRAAQALAPKSLPNPVQSKDGMAYIPIDDTAFLIPEKTWLKGYSRNSTDGMVSSITLHATVPDVQPWSQERNSEMYQPAGPGKKLLISIKGDEAHQVQNFSRVPNSIYGKSRDFIEEPSEQAEQGLRQFRLLWLFYNEKDAEKDAAQFGNDFVKRARDRSGKPVMSDIFYERIENNSVKYFIRCQDEWKGRIFQDCHLFFPWTQKLMIDIYFARDDISHIIAMTDKLSNHLREFEAAGLAYQAANFTTQSLSTER